MTLLDLLREKKSGIAEKWLEAIFRTYPLDTVGFLRKLTDPFSNPVAHRTAEAVPRILDALLADGLDSEAVTPALDAIVRVRAVQDFTPARAIGVLYLLKTLLREAVWEKSGKTSRTDAESLSLAKELLQFESKIDSLALISFEIYTQCRDQIHESRIAEVKHRYSSILRWAKSKQLTAEEPDDQYNRP
jgi:hypothetical protein